MIIVTDPRDSRELMRLNEAPGLDAGWPAADPGHVGSSRRSRWFLFVLGLSGIGPGAARASFQSTPQVHFDRDHSVWEVETRIHMDRRRYELALPAMKRSMHERPDDPVVAWRLVELFYKLRDLGEVQRVSRNFAQYSTPSRNFYHMLGVCFDLGGDYQAALGYYHEALKIDPKRYETFVRIAQVRVKQGLMYDAAKVLNDVLTLDNQYTPALEEAEIVRRLIRSNEYNVYRENNMVILFEDHRFVHRIEEFYPYMEAHRQILEERLQYHIPAIWVKVVESVPYHNQPPALFNDLQDVIYVSESALIHKDHVVFGHELAYMYLTRMTRRNAPRWLVEGLALIQARPVFFDTIPVRTANLDWVDLDRRITAEKQYLDFNHIGDLDQKTQAALHMTYLQTRFMLETYGWKGIHRLLAAYRRGETQFQKIIKDELHVKYRDLMHTWSVYSLTHYYFQAPGEKKF